MNNNLTEQIEFFLGSDAFGVVGASKDRNKYGNKVLRCYLQHQKKVYPVNSHEQVIEGLPCIDAIENLPIAVKSISIVTPPSVTKQIVVEAIAKGINNIWMQPGSESEQALFVCRQSKVNVIFGGPCILVTLGFTDNNNYSKI